MVNKELVAASSRPLVLSILAAGGEEYGYRILKRVKELSGGELEWTDGMLYPVLHRLEREGLIMSAWRTAETGRRRKYYRLAASGRRALEGERAQWDVVNNTLAKLWGGGEVPAAG